MNRQQAGTPAESMTRFLIYAIDKGVDVRSARFDIHELITLVPAYLDDYHEQQRNQANV